MRATLRTATAALLAAAPAFAAPYDKAVPGVERVAAMIARFFDFSGITRNPALLAGFAKFLFFILLFSVLYMGARKAFLQGNREDKYGAKTAKIVSFIVALIAVVFVPNEVVLAGGTLWSALLWSIILLAIPGILIYLAFKDVFDGGNQ